MTVQTLRRPAAPAPAGPVALSPRARRAPLLPPGVADATIVRATVRCLSRRLPRDLAAAWPRRLPPSWQAMWHDDAGTPMWGEDDLVAELSEEVGLDATRTVALARTVAAELDACLGGAMGAARHRLPEDVQTIVPRRA